MTTKRVKKPVTLTRAQRVIAFIENFCAVPEGALIGQRMKLLPFQREFVFDIYDNPVGTRRAYLSIARKNGKSGLIAALLLAHIAGPEAKQNSQIVSGARSREQAGLIFDLACKMIRFNEALTARTRIIPSSKRIVGLAKNVEYRALSAEGTTAHGLSPILAILDEAGQVKGPQDDFVDAIETSQGAHDAPLLIAISTQAPTDADLFSVWIDDAIRSNDPKIVCHLHAADSNAPLDDEAQWAKANPAMGIFRSFEDVKAQAEQAARMPGRENTFRNLVLNQRVTVHAPFISRGVWASNGGAVDAESIAKNESYAGLDLSAKTDLTAFVLAARDSDGVFHVEAHFWTPAEGVDDRAKRDRVPYDLWVRDGFLHTTPGKTVDYAFVARDIAEIVARTNLVSVAFDRWRIEQLKRELDQIGLVLPLIECGQGFKDMSPALDALEGELLNDRVRHGGHPVLTMCAANAVITADGAGNRKLEKHRATGRIDGMVAMAMAFKLASESQKQVIDQAFAVW